jgi:hypothetical protein
MVAMSPPSFELSFLPAITVARSVLARTRVVPGGVTGLPVGKTALLRQVAQQASGFRVTQIAGVELEMKLP